MQLSVLITAHNESNQEIENTIKSIRQTAGDRVEIVVVDDASQLPVDLNDKNVVLIRNEERCGVGPSRHIAALRASGTHLLITDAHMRFEPGWYEKAEERIDANPQVVYNATCVGLSPEMMDLSKSRSEYHGATLNIYGPDNHHPEVMQVLEGKWLPECKDNQEIACLMGACYFVPADWFHYIGGLRMLRGWGSDEPFLAIKTWLAGGECRMLKPVRIGHQFREKSVYSTQAWNLIYNKMMLAFVCLPMKEAWKLHGLHRGSGELVEAKNRIREDWGSIMAERHQFQPMLTRSFEWYLNKFSLTFP